MNETLTNTFKFIQYVWDYPHVRLGDVADTVTGERMTRAELSEAGEYPVYGGSLKPLGYHDKANRSGDTTFVIVKGCAGDVGYSATPFFASDGCLCLKPHGDVLSKFLFYAIEARRPVLLYHARAWGVAGISRADVENLKICVPNIEEQRRVVAFLDQYNAVSLPDLEHEAELRKQQTEHYRDRLIELVTLNNADN